MKTPRILPLLCLTLLILAASPAPAQAPQRLGIINLREVFEGYYKTKAADSTIKERAAEFGKEKESLVDSYTKLTEEYKQARDDANNQAISSAEREKRKKTAESKLLEVKEMEQTINQFDRQAMATLDEQERRMRGKLLEEIQVVVDAKSKQANYSLVFDVSSESRNRTPVILFSNGSDDLTQEVLKELNANAPAARLESTSPDK